jgi:hypothetical protein
MKPLHEDFLTFMAMYLSAIGVASLAALLLGGCSRATAEPDALAGGAVFREARSLRADSTLWPFFRRTVLLMGPKGHCSGWLGNDGRSVLTATHCFSVSSASSFSAHLVSGESATVVEAIPHPSEDVAVVRLGTALPVAPVTPHLESEAVTGKKLFLVGWDSKRTLRFSAACSAQEVDTGLLHYDCDTLPGMSGSPVFSVTQDRVSMWRLTAVHRGGTRGARLNAGTLVAGR